MTKKPLIIALVIAVLAGGGYYAFVHVPAQKAAEAAAKQAAEMQRVANEAADAARKAAEEESRRAAEAAAEESRRAAAQAEEETRRAAEAAEEAAAAARAKAEEAARAITEAARDAAGAAAMGTGAAAEATSNALGAAAQAMGQAADAAMDSAARTGRDTTAMIGQMLDADQLKAAIDASTLTDEAKMALKTQLESVGNSPEMLKTLSQRIMQDLGMAAPAQ